MISQKQRDKLYLFQMRDSIAQILNYTQKLTEDDFCSNSMVKDAVIRNLEVIGGANKRVSSELRNQHSNIEWSRMSSEWEKLFHDYIEVDVKTVWQIVEKLLPSLKNDIDFILSKIRP
jgi:uncharacterized protein with HEPN domain